jgi:hypothetical protein
MIIESGFIVAIGLLFIFFKCSWKARMRILSNPLAIDLLIFVALTILHWGTFSGVMVATTGAMITSGMLTLGRWMFGHVTDKKYFAGIWDVYPKLVQS